MGIEHITNKSTEDPEATGLVEAFMRHLKNIFHTAGVEREDLYLRLNNYLMQFRATPHATMRKCPAELLFGRKFVTKLPDLRTNPAKARKDIVEAKEDDKLAKAKMKKYKDASRHVKEHGIEVGDLVITKRKVTKHDSAYDQALQGCRHLRHKDQGHAGGWQAQDQGLAEVEEGAGAGQEELRRGGEAEQIPGRD